MTADLVAPLARAVLVLSAAIVAVLALRMPVRRAFGARIAYALWLIVPIASLATFLPARTIAIHGAPAASAMIAAAPHAVAQTNAAAPLATVPHFTLTLDLAPVTLAVWLAGFAVSLALLLSDQQRLMSRLRKAGAELVSDAIGPAVVGVITPRIVVPTDFSARYNELERTLVLEHERAHIRAGDVQVSALAAFLQCVLWFNPLAYIARRALRVDQELACDERVMARFGGARRAYGEAMLKAQLSAHALPLGCAWPALGERALKQRIAMLGRPSVRPARRMLGGVLCASITVAIATAAWLAQPARPAYATEEARDAGHASGSRLVEALMQGDTDEAHRLIQAGADVNFWSAGDGTPLVIATRLEDETAADAISRELLGAGADVNKAAPADGNPLIAASSRGDMALVTLFVAAGADVNGIVQGDETPLINAARHDRIDVARFLIAHGADVNLAVNAPTLDGHERRSPLSMAERGGHAEMARVLRDAGAT